MPVEQHAPELERLVDLNVEIEELGDGFGNAEGDPAEGPVWWKEGSYLLFSDIFNNRRMKWKEGEGFSVALDGSNQHNGLTRDRQGRLLACEHLTRRVTRTESDGSITVIANSFKGRQLNRPNDIIVDSQGNIYFTDPWTHRRPQDQWDLDFSGVYRLTPDLATLTLLVDDFVLPNGLALSPDETILYVNDSRRGHIRSFEINPWGNLAKHTDRIIADLTGERAGVPDGMKIDVQGNIYCGGSGGIHVLDPTGKSLGIVVHGQTATTNLCFGGDDWQTIFFTSRTTVGRFRVKVPGVPVPSDRG